jgi:hypothetical protein
MEHILIMAQLIYENKEELYSKFVKLVTAIFLTW